MCSTLAIIVGMVSATQHGQFHVVHSGSLTDASEFRRAIEPATRMIAKVVLYAQLTQKNSAIREDAILRIRFSAPSESNVEALVYVLQRLQHEAGLDNLELEDEAAEALYHFGPHAKVAIPFLIDVIKQNQKAFPSTILIPGNFRTPFEILFAVGQPAIIDLIRLIPDGNRFRRFHAATTIADILNGKQSKLNVSVLLSEHAVPTGDVSMPVLVKCLANKSLEIRHEAAQAIVRLVYNTGSAYANAILRGF